MSRIVPATLFALTLVVHSLGAARADTAAPLPVAGAVVQTVAWTTNGSERWLAVVSRAAVTKSPVRYQYHLTFLRPRRYAAPGTPDRSGYDKEFESPGNGPSADFLTGYDVGALPPSGAPAFSQSARIVGIVDGYLAVLKHEATADCRGSELALFAEPGEGAAEIHVRVVNRCSLAARIVATGHGREIEITGPYFRTAADPAKNDPACCPSLPHAVARLHRNAAGAYVLSKPYFLLRST